MTAGAPSGAIPVACCGDYPIRHCACKASGGQNHVLAPRYGQRCLPCVPIVAQPGSSGTYPLVLVDISCTIGADDGMVVVLSGGIDVHA